MEKKSDLSVFEEVSPAFHDLRTRHGCGLVCKLQGGIRQRGHVQQTARSADSVGHLCLTRKKSSQAVDSGYSEWRRRQPYDRPPTTYVGRVASIGVPVSRTGQSACSSGDRNNTVVAVFGHYFSRFSPVVSSLVSTKLPSFLYPSHFLAMLGRLVLVAAALLGTASAQLTITNPTSDSWWGMSLYG